MTRESFDSLELIEQINYINKELGENNSLTKICDNIGITRKAIRVRFLKIDYEFNDNEKQYIKVNNSTLVEEESKNKPTKKSSNAHKKVVDTNAQEAKIKALECQIESLEGHINNIYKLLDNNKCTEVSNSILKDNVLHKDLEGLRGTDIVARTFKLYKDIDKQLQEHLQDNNKYKKQDIINSIILSYLQNTQK